MTSADEADPGGGPRGFLAPYAEIFAHTAGLAVLRRRDHRPDADVHVRARHGAADLGRDRPLRRWRAACRRPASLGSAVCAPQLGRLDRPARPAPGARPGLRDLRAVGRRPGGRGRSWAPRTGRCSRAAIAGGATMPQTRADGAGPLVGAAGRVTAAAHRVLARVGRRRAVLRRSAPPRSPCWPPRCTRRPGWRCAAICCLAGIAVVRVPARRPSRRSPLAGCTGGTARRASGRGPVARVRARARLAAPALAVLVPVYLFLGAMFVTIDLSTVAFAAQLRAQGARRASSSAATRSAAGPAACGTGRGPGRRPPARRLAVTLHADRGRACARSGRCRTCWC